MNGKLFIIKCHLQSDGNDIGKSKKYVRSSGLLFKSSYTRHKCSFNKSEYRLKTTLFKYILGYKDKILKYIS